MSWNGSSCAERWELQVRSGARRLFSLEPVFCVRQLDGLYATQTSTRVRRRSRDEPSKGRGLKSLRDGAVPARPIRTTGRGP